MTKLLIEYGVLPNSRLQSGGWLPIVWENDRAMGNTWARRGFDRDDALKMAQIEALEHAARFTGDWFITVRPRNSK